MAPPLAALDITTRSPRTSLIDAEWEWLARRADAEDTGDGVAFTDRDTAPGLAPYSQSPAASSLSPHSSWQQPHEATSAPAPEATSWLGRRLELAFVAAILLSFAVGVVALPIGKSVVSRLQQDLWTDGYSAELDLAHAAPNSLSVTPAVAPQTPQPETVVPAAAAPEVTVAPVDVPVPQVDVAAVSAKAEPAGTKPAAARSVHARPRYAPPRWSPQPRRPVSDNPY